MDPIHKKTDREILVMIHTTVQGIVERQDAHEASVNRRFAWIYKGVLAMSLAGVGIVSKIFLKG